MSECGMLIVIPHHQRDLAQEGAFTARWRVAEHGDLATRRIERPGEQLQGCRSPRAVWPEKPDDLTRRNIEGQPADRRDLARLTPH